MHTNVTIFFYSEPSIDKVQKFRLTNLVTHLTLFAFVQKADFSKLNVRLGSQRPPSEIFGGREAEI